MVGGLCTLNFLAVTFNLFRIFASKFNHHHEPKPTYFRFH